VTARTKPKVLPKEKRRTERIAPFVAPCRIAKPRSRTRLAAYLTDLSLRGGRIHCDAGAPARGAAVIVEMRVAGQVTHLRLTGAVKWVRSAARGGHDFGFTFGRLAPGARQALEAVLGNFRRRAAQIA
jgi:PilZ domain-containing protein